MIKLIEKFSVKQWAVIAAVVMLVGCFMPLTASAETGDVFVPLGASEITEAEAMFAMAEYMQISADGLDDILLFIEVPEDNCVEVYERSTNVLSEIVYKDADGNYRGYVTGFSVTFDGDSLNDVIGDVAAGVGGVFDMSASGFKFITDNNLCMLMVSITLGGAAFGLLAHAFKVSRK